MLYMLGGAGVGNFGDELMVHKWLEFYRENGIDDSVVVDGASERILTELFSGIHRNVHFKNVFNKLKYTGPDDFWKSLRRGLNFYKNGGLRNYPELVRWADNIQNIKLMHLHGGGYLNSLWPKSAFLLGIAAATKLEYSCKLVATGIGLLPLPKVPDEYRADLERTFNAFDIFEMRDYQSSHFINEAISGRGNVFFGLDDTFLTPVHSSVGGGKRLHISFFSQAMPKLEQVLSSAPSQFYEQFDEVLFWECMKEEDQTCQKMVLKYIQNVKTVPMKKLVLEPLPVQPNDVMLTARFHPHLLAARAGVVGFYRLDGSYYDVKQGSVVELGSPFKPLEAFQSKDSQYEPGFNRILDFDAERVNIKRKLAQQIVKYYANA